MISTRGSGFLFGAPVWVRNTVAPYELQRQAGPPKCSTLKTTGQKLSSNIFCATNHLIVYTKYNYEMAGIAKLWISAWLVIFVTTVGSLL